MPKRTTIIINDNVYIALLQESVKRHGNAKNLSKVVNDVLGKTLLEKKGKDRIKELLSREKITSIKLEEFHKFRHDLSSRLEGP